MMRWFLLCALAAMALGGCDPRDAQPVVVAPEPVVYSEAVQAQAASELEALPAGSVLPVLVADYAVLRSQLRALQSGGAR